MAFPKTSVIQIGAKKLMAFLKPQSEQADRCQKLIKLQTIIAKKLIAFPKTHSQNNTKLVIGKKIAKGV